MASRERRIEGRILSRRSQLGYGDALAIRRARLARGGFGYVDIMLLPKRGPHRLVLIEAKHEQSADAAGKVVGQLLLYYVAALTLGRHGVRLLRRFAGKRRRAERAAPKSLQMLSGQSFKDDERALRQGPKLKPSEISLMIGLAREPSGSLKDLLTRLKRRHRIEVRVVTASGHRHLKIWPTAK